jgi:hypothetical protein
MLFTEPIVYCFALYDGLNYGIIVSRRSLMKCALDADLTSCSTLLLRQSH